MRIFAIAAVAVLLLAVPASAQCRGRVLVRAPGVRVDVGSPFNFGVVSVRGQFVPVFAERESIRLRRFGDRDIRLRGNVRFIRRGVFGRIREIEFFD